MQICQTTSMDDFDDEKYKNAKLYAKADTWFIENSLCKFICYIATGIDGSYSGLFSGYIIIDEDMIKSGQGHVLGDVRLDEESCMFDEFNIVVKEK